MAANSIAHEAFCAGQAWQQAAAAQERPGGQAMTDHANELRRYARKIAHPAGDVPAVMRAAADEIERLQSVIKDRRIRDGVLADDDERGSRARGDA